MTQTLRHRLVPASEPGADPACRLTRGEGQLRRADTSRLFAQLADQRQTARGNDFIFRGNADDLWEQISLFVDEESRCCPFFDYETSEQPDGVTLRVSAPPAPVWGP